MYTILNCHSCYVSKQDDVPRDPSSIVDLDNMDIDKHYCEEGDDYEEAGDDDNEREALSEHDTDETDNKGESGHMEIHLDECDSIHIQSTPCDFGVSPLHAKVLEFPSSSQATQRDHLMLHPKHEPAEEQYHEEDQEGDHNDEDDHDAGDEAEDDVVHEEDHEDDHDVVNQGDEDHIAPDVTLSIPFESGEDLPPPSPSKPKASKRSKLLSNRTSPKDRQSRRHTPKVHEPAITESLLEDKIMRILSKTLPTMLSGLIQEAIGQS